MTDILIRGVPDEVLAAIDARAKRVGLSRTAYLRRALERERLPGAGPVTLSGPGATAAAVVSTVSLSWNGPQQAKIGD